VAQKFEPRSSSGNARDAGVPFFGAGVAASSSIKGGLTRLGVNFKF
jgi:hypothetical protein